MGYYTLSDVIRGYEKGKKIKFLFFWGHTPPRDGHINESCFSQWWMCNFVIDNITYCCAEQYMMVEKARTFQDNAALQKIMKAKHPKQMKEFGRQVNNFDETIWNNNCYSIVKKGNFAKFSQNKELWDFLKQTKNRVIVEASPRDKIWGIGLGKENPDAMNPTKWKGKNLLGFALTEIRDSLLAEEIN